MTEPQWPKVGTYWPYCEKFQLKYINKTVIDLQRAVFRRGIRFVTDLYGSFSNTASSASHTVATIINTILSLW